MIKQTTSIEKFGQVIGYLVSYFIFTTILYVLLMLLNNLPTSWSYFHLIGLTLGIVLVGIIIGRLLK